MDKKAFSENGMIIVNILFLIAAFLSGGIIMVLAFLLWLVFLIFSLKNTKSKFMKVFYLVIIICCILVLGFSLKALILTYLS